jgi:hypothetical protein
MGTYVEMSDLSGIYAGSVSPEQIRADQNAGQARFASVQFAAQDATRKRSLTSACAPSYAERHSFQTEPSHDALSDPILAS